MGQLEKALELAGIHCKTRNRLWGSWAQSFAAVGQRPGVLEMDAVELVARKVPSDLHHEKIAACRGAAIVEAHELGITSLQTVSATDEELELLDEIREQGYPNLRVYASILPCRRRSGARAQQTSAGISRPSLPH